MLPNDGWTYKQIGRHNYPLLRFVFEFRSRLPVPEISRSVSQKPVPEHRERLNVILIWWYDIFVNCNRVFKIPSNLPVEWKVMWLLSVSWHISFFWCRLPWGEVQPLGSLLRIILYCQIWILQELLLKFAVLWDKTARSLAISYWHFGRYFRLYLQGGVIHIQ